jgi:hypothetical protein
MKKEISVLLMCLIVGFWGCDKKESEATNSPESIEANADEIVEDSTPLVPVYLKAVPHNPDVDQTIALNIVTKKLEYHNTSCAKYLGILIP